MAIVYIYIYIVLFFFLFRTFVFYFSRDSCKRLLLWRPISLNLIYQYRAHARTIGWPELLYVHHSAITLASHLNNNRIIKRRRLTYLSVLLSTRVHENTPYIIKWFWGCVCACTLNSFFLSFIRKSKVRYNDTCCILYTRLSLEKRKKNIYIYNTNKTPCDVFHGYLTCLPIKQDNDAARTRRRNYLRLTYKWKKKNVYNIIYEYAGTASVLSSARDVRYAFPTTI